MITKTCHNSTFVFLLFMRRHVQRDSWDAYHKEEANADHLGRARHVVMSQSSPLDQLLGDDITDTHQRPWRTNRGQMSETLVTQVLMEFYIFQIFSLQLQENRYRGQIFFQNKNTNSQKNFFTSVTVQQLNRHRKICAQIVEYHKNNITCNKLTDVKVYSVLLL